MRTLLNIIWVVFGGLWLALLYVLAGVVMCVLIITIPFGVQAKLAGFVLWPFGRTVVRRPEAGTGSLIGNVLWVVLVGWELAIGHIVTAFAIDHDHRDPARARQSEARADLAAAVRANRRAGGASGGYGRHVFLSRATSELVLGVRGRAAVLSEAPSPACLKRGRCAVVGYVSSTMETTSRCRRRRGGH